MQKQISVQPPVESLKLCPINKCDIIESEPSDFEDDDAFVLNKVKGGRPDNKVNDKTDADDGQSPLVKDKKVDFAAGSDVISLTFDEHSENEDEKVISAHRSKY